MDAEELRLECLKLAIAHNFEPVVDAAAQFYAFVSGEDVCSAKAKLEAVRVAVNG